MEMRDRLIDNKEYAKQMRENAVKDENGIVRVSIELWEQIADIVERSIVPPCKVGDYIYWAEDGSITEFIVHSISIVFLKDNDKSVRVQFIDEYGHRNFDYQFNAECFGETVFLTKQEAENALKERDGNGNERN